MRPFITAVAISQAEHAQRAVVRRTRDCRGPEGDWCAAAWPNGVCEPSIAAASAEAMLPARIDAHSSQLTGMQAFSQRHTVHGPGSVDATPL